VAIRASERRVPLSGGVERLPARLFGGTIGPDVYALLRIGLAVLVLLRTSDVTRGLLDLDHHHWVRGLEYDPRAEDVASPGLWSPLLEGLPDPGSTITMVSVVARTALAGLLLFGVVPRLSAAGLAVVGFSLMALDRYRFLHHLHLLWLSCAWLALAPSGERLSVVRLFGRRGRARVERWPLQLVRAHVMAVYAASGIAKLDGSWLSGRTLAELGEAGFVSGPLWEATGGARAASVTAPVICGLELALPLLLAWRRTRLGAVVVATALHATIDASMMVSTFGATMVLLLASFLPWDRRATLSPEVRDGEVDGGRVDDGCGVHHRRRPPGRPRRGRRGARLPRRRAAAHGRRRARQGRRPQHRDGRSAAAADHGRDAPRHA
jgi:hypothetical protein